MRNCKARASDEADGNGDQAEDGVRQDDAPQVGECPVDRPPHKADGERCQERQPALVDDVQEGIGDGGDGDLRPGPGDAASPDSPMPKVMEFIAKHYHQPSDELDLPIDWTAAAKFTAIQVDLVRRIGDVEGRPAWNAGDFFGDSFGKK